MSAARRALALFAAAIVLAAGAPRAAADEVAELSELLIERPEGMEEAEWRRERREAARRLGRIGDPDAVPALIQVVETETFDVVAERSIEALAEIGDDRAVPALREASRGDDRDPVIRAAARRALEDLGADPDVEEADDPEPDPDDPDDPDAPAGDASAEDLLRDLDPGEAPEGPEFDPDVLAATERLTIAAGGARLEYDTARGEPAADGDVSATYERLVEEENRGVLLRASGDASAGALQFDDGGGSRTVNTGVSAAAELRLHAGDGRGFFGLVRGDAAAFLNGLHIGRPDDESTFDVLWGVDAHATLGGGYGRILPVGSALRVRRIERALEEAGALARPISADVAQRLQRAWWALRGEQGSYRHIEATLAVLREAGVVLEEPSPRVTYKILRVLEDGQLSHRLEGWEARLGVTESVIARAGDIPVATGRAETVIGRARYGSQSEGGTHEIEGEAQARYRIFSGDDPAAWLARSRIAYRTYFYNDVYDPVGALEIRGEAGLSDDGQDNHIASRAGGGAGWLFFPNRASRYRLGADVRLESMELFVGVSFEARHGLLDVGFVGPGGLRGLGG